MKPLSQQSLYEILDVPCDANPAVIAEAVERAIRKARTLPLPPDENVRQQFVNPNRLKLEFSPGDGK